MILIEFSEIYYIIKRAQKRTKIFSFVFVPILNLYLIYISFKTVAIGTALISNIIYNVSIR